MTQIKQHPLGKIDIHHTQRNLETALKKLEINNGMVNENKQLIKQFIVDCQLGKTLRHRSKKRIGPSRCVKYIGILQQLSRIFNKPFGDIGQEDMERLVLKLDNDQILSRSGKPYSVDTKGDIRKTIKKFWKWFQGDNRRYPELVEWIETYVPIKDLPTLSLEQVELLAMNCGNVRNRALIMVLFDSGTRIQELLNVRLKADHVCWQEELDCYTIRIEFSKTKARTVSLPLSSKHLEDWLNIHPDKKNDTAQLFPTSYSNARQTLNRIGIKHLGFSISPQTLRRSSATYYANILNHYQLCNRYGWTMNSEQVNRYINRAGIVEKEAIKSMKRHQRDEHKEERQQFSHELSHLKEANQQLQGQLTTILTELRELKNGRGMLINLQHAQNLASSGNLNNMRTFDFVFETNLQTNK